MSQRLHPFDLVLVALYLVGITLFGLRFRERRTGAGAPQRSLKSYFLAGNTIPWWAIALSIVSAETSTLTIISIPGVAFAGDFSFLQLVIGYMLGRVVVAVLFLPRYFRGEMLTAYQLIDRRFGPVLHKVTAGLFLLTRAAAEGVRVFAVSIVVGIAIGTGDTLSIAIISALTLLYTFEGGMAAVIWTDVVQMAIYIGGTFVALWSLGHHVPGGWPQIVAIAAPAGKFHLFNFALNLTTTYTFWAGILGGTFLTMASHGTDQLMVQRLLAARNLRESRLALLSSGIVIFMQFTLFLLIGVGLYVFYGAASTTGAPFMAGLHPGMSGLTGANAIHSLTPDRIFPTFIVRELPVGIAGLLVAAILAAAMSNLSAALNSLSSTTVVDFYLRLRPEAALAENARERNLIARSSTVLWAIVLFVIAVYSLSVGGKGHVVEIGLSIASVAYGCLLGVFLLGTLTRFATETATALAMLCGFALNLWLWQGSFPRSWVFSNAGAGGCKAPGEASCYVHVLTIPHIAFTWYVLIGALVTFVLGALFSLLFRKQSKRTTTISATVLLLLATSWTCHPEQRGGPAAPGAPHAPVVSTGSSRPEAMRSEATPVSIPATSAAPDFTPITTLVNDAIAAHKLPGAVVLIGHDGKVVFEQAYGNRKLAGEPGLDGKPGPAEPMTEDTIFDMASLTKCLATATAVMQLYEAGKITSFDDPVEKYLPAFNESHDPARAKVTLRMLLTHTSGEAPDVDLRDPWGLAAPDRTEGLHRALTTPLKAAPGSIFTYSDINFILLGDLVETLSGQPEDVYVADHIFKPLGMSATGYHSFFRACDWISNKVGSAIEYKQDPPSRLTPCQPSSSGSSTTTVPPGAVLGCGVSSSMSRGCGGGPGAWSPVTNFNTAPTAHDNEGTAATNADFDHLLRGTVHDPTTRRMGGVAGHAGVFSTAHDIGLYAAALLQKLRDNTGPFPLKQSTLQLMTQPEQPGHNPDQIPAAQAATNTGASFIAGSHPAMSGIAGSDPSTNLPGLASHYPAIKGQNLRGFGWDIDTAFSKPRGAIFPIGSFGHTGFTGTSLWMDPASDTYVLLLANAIHPRGNPPISNLRGQVATAAATALGLAATSAQTLTGIDVLQATHFAALQDLHRLGLLTNQSGRDAEGRRTADILASDLPRSLPHTTLTTLFSPEHGINGALDREGIASTTDTATHLPVISLYGKPADRHPTHDQLKALDGVVVDLQDAGVRFWTYEAAAGYLLEAAATEKSRYGHDLQIIVLDRPNPVGGLAVQGPISDAGTESYVNYMPLPVRHGLTLGELLRYANASQHLGASLTVIPLQHWQRSQFYVDTGLPWVNPSPNLRSPEAAIVYPALGLIETTNVSVGRGTAHPFAFFGAPWMQAATVATALTARHIPGVAFTAATEAIAEDANHYPFHGQTIEAVEVVVTDRAVFDSPEAGVEILAVLHSLYPAAFQLEKAMTLLCNRATLEAVQRGDDPRTIAAGWQPMLQAFTAATAPLRLYRNRAVE